MNLFEILKAIAIIILVITIVMIVATLVYIFVNQPQPEGQYIEGWVVDAYQINTTHINGTSYLLWTLTLSPNYQDFNNSTSYTVLFPANGYPSPPPEDVKCRFYYNEVEGYMAIYKVKSL